MTFAAVLALGLTAAAKPPAPQSPAHTERSCTPVIDSPRVTCDRWPSFYDAKSWIQDVWRIESAQTPEQKALALYKWVRLQLHWGDQCFDGTGGKSVLECDAIKKLNIFPYGEGSDLAGAAAALAQAGGLKAAEARVGQHSQLDVFYKDSDGQERWHRLDPLWGIVVYERTAARIATWQEIKADPAIALRPSKTALPWADRTADREQFAEVAATAPERRIQPSVYTMDKAFYAGESYLLSWDHIPGLAFHNSNPDARDLMTGWGTPRFQYAEGDFDKLAFGHELLLPHAGVFRGDIQVRQSHGALLFMPLTNERFADSLYTSATNTAVGGEGKTLHPAKAGKPAELIYLVQTPYVIVDSSLSGDFLLGEGGRAKVSIARADWRQRDGTLDQVIPDKPQWKVVWESGNTTGPRGMRLLESDLHLRGEYRFLVKVDMLAAKDPASIEVSSLIFTVRFQEGIMALPRLLPGTNVIHVSGGQIKPGYQLCVTYTWDDPEGTARTATRLTEHLPSDFEVKAAGTRPADVHTRGLILQAVHKADRQKDQ